MLLALLHCAIAVKKPSDAFPFRAGPIHLADGLSLGLEKEPSIAKNGTKVTLSATSVQWRLYSDGTIRLANRPEMALTVDKASVYKSSKDHGTMFTTVFLWDVRTVAIADWNRWLYHPTDKSLRLLRYPDFLLSAEWPKKLEAGLPIILHDGVLGARHKAHRQWSWELTNTAPADAAVVPIAPRDPPVPKKVKISAVLAVSVLAAIICVAAYVVLGSRKGETAVQFSRV